MNIIDVKDVLDKDNALELCLDYLKSQDVEVIAMFLNQWFPSHTFEWIGDEIGIFEKE
jgi:hypothetical protein